VLPGWYKDRSSALEAKIKIIYINSTVTASNRIHETVLNSIVKLNLVKLEGFLKITSFIVINTAEIFYVILCSSRNFILFQTILFPFVISKQEVKKKIN